MSGVSETSNYKQRKESTIFWGRIQISLTCLKFFPFLFTHKCKFLFASFKPVSLFFILVIFHRLTYASENDRSPYSYDQLLKQAVNKMEAFEYGKALDRLSFAKEKNYPLDYRYYYILGEINFRMGKMSESMEAYNTSLEKEPGQTPLLLKMSEFYESDRRPHYALEYKKKYLRFVPDDKNEIYRTAILAIRSGENNLANQLLSDLESDTTYELEKDAILELISSQIKKREWDMAIDNCKKYLTFFPREELLHEYLVLALRNKKDEPSNSHLEKAIVDSAAIFSDNANFSVRYGIYLQQQERMMEALAAFRRAFQITLIHKSNPQDQYEILFLVRQTYSFLNRNHDSRAISSLQILLESGNALNESLILQAIKSYPKNREILEFAKNFYELKGDPSQTKALVKMIKDRDIENEETELVFVIGPFSREELKNPE